MIDVRLETLISFAEAAKLLPRGSRPSYATWWRWHRRGVRGVRLETVLIGGRRMTSPAALFRFIHSLTVDAAPVAKTGSGPKRGDGSSVRKAEQVLRDLGVLSDDHLSGVSK